MRTLVRAGLRGVLVRIEGDRKGVRFYLSGPVETWHETYFDADLAVRSFEAVEHGAPLRRARRHASLVQQLRQGLPRIAASQAARLRRAMHLDASAAH